MNNKVLSDDVNVTKCLLESLSIHNMIMANNFNDDLKSKRNKMLTIPI